MTGSPADMGPGYVVRIRMGGGGLTYCTGRMTKDDAEVYQSTFIGRIRTLEDNGYLGFAVEHASVYVRAERVTSIEVIRSLFPAKPYVSDHVGQETR